MPGNVGKNRLERWEVALVKAMLATGSYVDQDILAYFTRPTRSINNARISEIKSGKKHKTTAAAGPKELEQFLRAWPQIDWNTGLHLLGDELIIKSREAMLQAVQTYNNPRAQFRSELFIVTAIIAWTYLLHAFYKAKAIDFRHYRKSGGQAEVLKTKYGADKHWELEECLKHEACPVDQPTIANLKFLIAIRHEIEHQMTRRIDDAISAKLQACCLNYNRTIKSIFGPRFSLDGDLSFALQFSGIDIDQRNLLLKEMDLPTHLVAASQALEQGLSDKLIRDPRYSYRVSFVQRSSNSKGRADQVVEFIKPDSREAQDISRILLKETERQKYKPAQIVSKMRGEGFTKFREHEHTELWKVLDAKNPAHNFGVYLKDGDWWWYESWVDRVRQHCRENSAKYGADAD